MSGESRVTVNIDFHGPFRIGTGSPGSGATATVDTAEPIPSSSIKGLMRASAKLLLPDRTDLVDEVFGGQPYGSPWHWNPPRFDDPPLIQRRARVEIDPTHGTARSDHLAFNLECWARGARFSIELMGHLPAAALATHRVVLACAAAGVHALGAQRRRGLGWVTCTPTDPRLDDTLIHHLIALRTRTGGIDA